MRRSRFTTWVWILATAFFAMRLGGDHLHLCLDGQEPAVTLHTEDSAEHHKEGGHQDRDIELPGTLLIKKLTGFDDLPVALLGALLLLGFLPTLRTLFTFPPLPVPALAGPLDLRPPPRGPPR